MSAVAVLEYEIAIATLKENATYSSGTPNTCGTPFTRFPAEQRLQFKDPEVGTSCGEMVHRFDVPPRATLIQVAFLGDRQVVVRQGAQPPVVAKQETKLYDTNGKLVAAFAYFDSSDASKPRQAFDVPWTLSPGTTNVSVSWYFEDQGYSFGQNLANPGFAEAFGANVTNPRIRIDDYPIDSGAVLSTNSTHADNVTHTTTTVALNATRPSPAPNGTMALTVSIIATAEFIGLNAPDGRMVDRANLSVTEAPGTLQLHIDPGFIEERGYGTYGLVFESFVADPPPPPPTPPPQPTRFYALTFALIALPLVPGAVALRSNFRIQSRARGRFRSVAWTMAGLFVLASAAYVGLLLFTAQKAHLTTMATVPLTPEAWWLNLQYVILAVAFGILAILGGRYLVHSIEADLHERQEMQSQLERSNKDLEQFAYVASHDLQAPLRTISGFSQILDEEYGPKLNSEARGYLRKTVQGSKRMQALINDLLAFSRVGTRTLQAERVDLNEVASHVLADIEEETRATGARIQIDRLPVVDGEPRLLAEVLSNLVQNAIKYRNPRRAPRIRVSAEPGDVGWIVSIRDNGVGIPKDQFGKLFVIFNRLVPRDSPIAGTGLGLAIVKKIVERHGGHVGVDSTLGAGSRFHFSLPAKVQPG